MEGFFSLSCRLNECEVIDLFASRYGWSVDEIMSIDADTFLKLIPITLKKKSREAAKLEWNQILPLILTKVVKDISFEEYYRKISGEGIDRRPTDVIMAEVADIRKQMEQANESI